MTVQPPGVVLYHADWGRSCRAIWTLRELGVPFKINVIDWMKVKDKQFMKEISPLGRLPVLYDGSVHIYESGSMVQYLLEKYSKGKLDVPTGTPERAHFLQWLWMAETLGMTSAVDKMYLYKMFPDEDFPPKNQELLDQGIKNTKKFLKDLETHLSQHHKNEWVAGPDLSAADIMLSYTLGLLQYSTERGANTPAPQVLTHEDFPVLSAYWQRMQKLPGYKDCFQDINLLPVGEYTIEPDMSFEGKGTRELTVFTLEDFKKAAAANAREEK